MSLESSKRSPTADEDAKCGLSTKRQATLDKVELDGGGDEGGEIQIVTLRGIISGRDATGIIEENGENIRILQEKTGSQIHLSENVLGSIERILTCTGTPKSIAKTFLLIIRLLRNEDLDTTSTPDDKLHRIRLVIPHVLIEHIIGKHGATINEIQKISGARMSASDILLPLSTERTLVIYGIESAIYKAIFHVAITLFQQADRMVNLQTCMYSPLSMHGGYGYPITFQRVLPNDTMLTPGNPYGIPPNTSMYQNYQTSNYMPADPQAIAAYNIQPQNQANSHNTQQGQTQQLPQQLQQLQQSQPQQPQQSQQSQQSPQSQPAPGQPVTQQIFIPNDMVFFFSVLEIYTNFHYTKVGAIIGKGGIKINEIRQLSGSHIKINEPIDNSTERLVTVTGTPECNQMALYMLYSRLEIEKAKS
ncbi:hypothetical protein MERGE_000953 [Pneumocystis wakefieldiae]|uniref:K Homology domain-containing protein n=1 Tax=Pneumocystis wakefieldiae TaxID=38082 RepID=A0A899FXQ1_9ASCO|nr:hypothetical protein MERGE_000953 [Pneumocystis wakefieldiae]